MSARAFRPEQARARSSFHAVSGDVPQGVLGRIRYGLAFARENIEALGAAGVPFRAYRPRLDRAALEHHFGAAIHRFTANRILCSDFLIEQAGGLLPRSAGIVDLGCGDGTYSVFLKSLCNYHSYLGIDQREFPAWQAHRSPSVTFRACALGESVIDVSHNDFIFSISALEHVHHDKQIFLDLRSTVGKRLRHLHLIPGLPSFFQYRLHGYRRYCRKYVQSLTDIPGVSNVQLYGLGNGVSRAIQRPGLPAADSVLAALERRREQLEPASFAECPFLALSFEQDLSASAQMADAAVP